MPTLLLVRHGRSTANTAGVLAGWTPDVHLDDAGRTQAADLAQRLAPVPVASFVVSPLERCQETAAALRAVDGPDGARPDVVTEDRLGECDYGDWTGAGDQGPGQGAAVARRAGAPVGGGVPRPRG